MVVGSACLQSWVDLAATPNPFGRRETVTRERGRGIREREREREREYVCPVLVNTRTKLMYLAVNDYRYPTEELDTLHKHISSQ